MPVTITAHASDDSGNPIQGTVITFSSNNDGYFTEPNDNVSTTDESGNAIVIYVPTADGNHSISAISTNGVSGQLPTVITSNGVTGENKVIKYEYWIDNNYASKTTKGIVPVNNLVFNKDLDLPILSDGFHSLHLRFMDMNNRFSEINSIYFHYDFSKIYIDNKLVSYEWWLDANFSERHSGTFPPIKNINLLQDFEITGLTKGMHSFNFRIKDIKGKFSEVSNVLFYYNELDFHTNKNISYEYWFDNDIQNIRINDVDPSQNLILLHDVDLGKLYNGLHTFNLRIKDDENLYSTIMQYMFYYSGLDLHSNKIIAYEYWFDDDVQNITFVNTPPEQNYILLDDIKLKQLPKGLHTLNIRIKDDENLYSNLLQSVFYKPEISHIPNLVRGYRFWFDNEVDHIQDITMQDHLNPFDLIIDVNIPALSAGNHSLYLQFKDENSKWSIPIAHAFSYDPLTFTIKVILEGPFNGTNMNTTLNSSNYLPFSQPYSFPPWNYNDFGYDKVTSIPNSNIVDWVLFELRKTSGPASTATSDSVVARRSGFLKNDGSIVGLDGISPIKLSTAATGNFYGVVWHRNHLGIMSAITLSKSGNVYTYDYSTGFDKVYGGSLSYKQLGTGTFGMLSGDGNDDSQINNLDKNDIWKGQLGNSGYLRGDFDMSGTVNTTDKNKWSPNSAKGSQVPE